MAKILIAGAVDLSQKEVQEFAVSIGEEVIKQGHILLTGCLNEFDKAIAKAAFDWVNAHGLEPGKCIRSYVPAGTTPIHQYGIVLRSQLPDWSLTHHQLYVPEQIHCADVAILVGGSKDTMSAANWARIDNKPLLPITTFGGSAELAYKEELKEFDKKYGAQISQPEYELLNRISSDWGQFTHDIIGLAEKIISPKNVFVIMSFSDTPQLQDVYESFKEVCKEYDYDCSRVDNNDNISRIIPEILDRMKKSAFILADLTEESPNVYYELGYAHGIGKSVIVTAHKGTKLPFDVRDIPTIFWEGQKQFRDELGKKIKAIAATHGRA